MEIRIEGWSIGSSRCTDLTASEVKVYRSRFSNDNRRMGNMSRYCNALGSILIVLSIFLNLPVLLEDLVLRSVGLGFTDGGIAFFTP